MSIALTDEDLGGLLRGLRGMESKGGAHAVAAMIAAKDVESDPRIVMANGRPRIIERVVKAVRRSDPCRCGSNKKAKHCCRKVIKDDPQQPTVLSGEWQAIFRDQEGSEDSG